MEKLIKFDFIIYYKNGKNNFTDNLFRRPNHKNDVTKTEIRKKLFLQLLEKFYEKSLKPITINIITLVRLKQLKKFQQKDKNKLNTLLLITF